MANIVELTPEEEVEYAKWVAERPPAIQEMIKTHPPNKLYRLTTTDQRVTIYSYGEDGTVSVIVSGKYNFLTFDRKVFGIPLSELVECDLPPEGEVVGTVLTDPKDVETYIDVIRPVVLAERDNFTSQSDQAAKVMELHNKSGKGLMACKLALIAHEWDMEATIRTMLREARERNSW
jgi:hypothetical protein